MKQIYEKNQIRYSIKEIERMSDYIQNPVKELSKEYLFVPYGSKCSCKSCKSCGGGCYGCKGACGCKKCSSLDEKLDFLEN